MHQHVQLQRFLLADGMGDFCLHRRLVAGFIQPAGLVVAAGLPDGGGLRKGADGRGREQRQLQVPGLPGGTLGIRAVPLAQFGRNGCQRSLDRRGMHTRGLPPRLDGGPVGIQFGLHAGPAMPQGAGQYGQFVQLLHGKRQPGPDFGIQLFFTVEVDRHVQQRA